jgi:hypothetical protein
MTTEPEELRWASALGCVCLARVQLAHTLDLVGTDEELAAAIKNAQVLLGDVQQAVQEKIAQVLRKKEEQR